jgi:hypothetical protein
LIDWSESVSAGDRKDVPISASIPSQDLVLRFKDRYMDKKHNTLSGYDASEGALYVLFAMVLAGHAKSPRVFAIDNVDAALNPRLARSLMAHLCDWIIERPKPLQILLTCHNPIALDGLPIGNDAVRLFVVQRSARGATVVRRIELTQELQEKARDGKSLSQLWVDGYLGGVPNV